MIQAVRYYTQFLRRWTMCSWLGHDWLGHDFHLCDRCGLVEGEALDMLEEAIEQVIGPGRPRKS